MNHPVVFFVSSGRSGTQWLCDVLGRIYGDIADVTHEPLKRAYWPKRYLRHSKDYCSSPYFDELDRHLRHVVSVSENCAYIETGWPCFPALPLLRERFGSRLKVVQLVRNPIVAAASLVTHNYYSPSLNTEVVVHGQLEPADPGTRLTGWADKWDDLSRFEKCLFHWAEIHNYAEEFRQEIDEGRFLRIRSEDIFNGVAGVLKGLTDFLELPYRPALSASVGVRVDQYHGKTRDKIHWKEIYGHPDVLALANMYGYELKAVNKAEIKSRYIAPPRHIRAVRRLLNMPARLRQKYLKN